MSTAITTTPSPVAVVQVQRLDPDVPLPSYQHPGDAGADLITTVDAVIAPGERVALPTGLALALPAGYAAFIHPRSGLALKRGLGMVNAPGTIDAGFRGELRVILINMDPREPVIVRRGERIAQMVIQRVELAQFEEVAALPASQRAHAGFGSTGGCQALTEPAPVQ